MTGNAFDGFEDLSAEPIEVQLVEQVAKCRACDWFWRPAPYGPYPAFDFVDEFPAQLQERTNHQYKDKQHADSVAGRSRRQAIVNPQILHGCRKAPVMTIGINPNLTGFWPTTDGARWSYPLFSNFPAMRITTDIERPIRKAFRWNSLNSTSEQRMPCSRARRGASNASSATWSSER